MAIDPNQDRYWRIWPKVREVALFLVGIGLLIEETFRRAPRDDLLLVAAALVGLPIASFADRVASHITHGPKK